MSRMKLKLMSAGVLAACAIGLVTLRVAWATPAQGFFTTLIAGPVAMEEIDIKSNTDDHKIKIQTRGEWEARVVNLRIVPGGNSGWHSHPGAVFVVVKAGTITFHYADGTSAVHPAGTGFVEDADDVALAENKGTTDVEAVVLFLTRAGEAPRTDEPQP